MLPSMPAGDFIRRRRLPTARRAVIDARATPGPSAMYVLPRDGQRNLCRDRFISLPALPRRCSLAILHQRVWRPPGPSLPAGRRVTTRRPHEHVHGVHRPSSRSRVMVPEDWEGSSARISRSVTIVELRSVLPRRTDQASCSRSGAVDALGLDHDARAELATWRSNPSGRGENYGPGAHATLEATNARSGTSRPAFVAPRARRPSLLHGSGSEDGQQPRTNRTHKSN